MNNCLFLKQLITGDMKCVGLLRDEGMMFVELLAIRVNLVEMEEEELCYFVEGFEFQQRRATNQLSHMVGKYLDCSALSSFKSSSRSINHFMNSFGVSMMFTSEDASSCASPSSTIVPASAISSAN